MFVCSYLDYVNGNEVSLALFNDTELYAHVVLYNGYIFIYWSNAWKLSREASISYISDLVLSKKKNHTNSCTVSENDIQKYYPWR